MNKKQIDKLVPILKACHSIKEFAVKKNKAGYYYIQGISGRRKASIVYRILGDRGVNKIDMQFRKFKRVSLITKYIDILSGNKAIKNISLKHNHVAVETDKHQYRLYPVGYYNTDTMSISYEYLKMYKSLKGTSYCLNNQIFITTLTPEGMQEASRQIV